MKRFILCIICDWLEKLCVLTHWLNPITIKLFNKWCIFTEISYRMDKKYNLGVWKECQSKNN